METEKERKSRRALYVKQRLEGLRHKRREADKIAYELFLCPKTIWRDWKTVK